MAACNRKQQRSGKALKELGLVSFVTPAHCVVIGGVRFAVCEVGPCPVALGVPSPLSVLCAHFGRHRWKHI